MSAPLFGCSLLSIKRAILILGGRQQQISTFHQLFMRKEYDFSKSVKNPYAKHLKKQVTLRLGIDVIDYFKKLAEETGVPYQNLINLYLQDCAHSQKKT